jgi:hypothetical protein
LIKKIIVLFLLTNLLFAKDTYEMKLYEKVIPSLFKKDKVKVYVDKKVKTLLSRSEKFIFVDDCSDASLMIGKKFDNLSNRCKDKPLFATNYRVYKTSLNCFGAFYWRKGRPQLIFKKDMISKFGIELPNSFKKYAK